MLHCIIQYVFERCRILKIPSIYFRLNDEKKKHCGFVHLAKHVWFLSDSSFAFVQFHFTKDYACEVKFSSHVKMKILLYVLFCVLHTVHLPAACTI